MTSFVLRYLVIVFAILLVGRFVPGITVEGLTTALLAALALGALNLFVRPVIIILTLPVTLITLGLFILVINTCLFWGASLVVPGFHVDGFVPAFLGALGVSVVSLVANRFF